MVINFMFCKILVTTFLQWNHYFYKNMYILIFYPPWNNDLKIRQQKIYIIRKIKRIKLFFLFLFSVTAKTDFFLLKFPLWTRTISSFTQKAEYIAHIAHFQSLRFCHSLVILLIRLLFGSFSLMSLWKSFSMILKNRA